MVEAALASAATGARVDLDAVFARAGDAALAEARAAGESDIAEVLNAWAGGPPR